MKWKVITRKINKFDKYINKEVQSGDLYVIIRWPALDVLHNCQFSKSLTQRQ